MTTSHEHTDPAHLSVTDEQSIWTCGTTTSGSGEVSSYLMVKKSAGGKEHNFTVKAVCYSPCPIGASNNNAPNIGDWFWDSYTNKEDVHITNWKGTWSKDLPKIAALGANTIRVYGFLTEQIPDPKENSHSFTHQSFLNACQTNGLYVIVGIPLPASMFDYGEEPALGKTFWENNLTNTIAAVADHPAVLGFTIANEVDNGAVDTYGPREKAKHWWHQVRHLAKKAKDKAPNKLIGIANHDDSGICEHAGQYMATCEDIDYWGVNSYEPDNFNSVFGTPSGTTVGYSTLGSMVSSVTIKDGGAGYASVPEVTFSAPASGETAEGTAVIKGGKVTEVYITKTGHGYESAPTVTIAAPEHGDQATGDTAIGEGLRPVLLTEYGFPSTSRLTEDTLYPATGVVRSVKIRNGGKGYRLAPTVTFSDPPAALGQAGLNGNGGVLYVNITSPGLTYEEAPEVHFSAPQQADGHKAQGEATVLDGYVKKVTIKDAGSGYSEAPTVTFAPPPPAEGVAQMHDDEVIGVAITKASLGYTNPPKVKFSAAPAHGETAIGEAEISMGIYADEATEENVASTLTKMIPKAFAEGLNMGLCYFEYCDEWWNQSTYKIAPKFSCPGEQHKDSPNGGKGGEFSMPNLFTPYGGPPACGFPNYYWDNDGFGLYSVAVGTDRNPAMPWNQYANEPSKPLDTRTERTAVLKAVKTAFE